MTDPCECFFDCSTKEAGCGISCSKSCNPQNYTTTTSTTSTTTADPCDMCNENAMCIPDRQGR